MPARLNPSHDARTRDKIKTSQLLNRLTSFGLGEKDPQTNKPVEMSSAQVTAALGVLRKTLPDLSNTELSGQVGVQPLDALLNAVDDKTRGIPTKANGHDERSNGQTRV